MIAFETWISDRMARHAAEEAERTHPVSVAYQALIDLRDALAAMTPAERNDIRNDLDALTADLDEHAWASFGAELIAH